MRAALQDHDYGVGLEGGLEQIGDRWFASGWIVVARRGSDELGVGTSARFEVRGQMLRRLLAGEEMGPVVDALSGQRDVKKSGGMMGEITNGNLKRNDCYAHGVLFAFAPFVSPRAYWDEA